ncbi:crotonase/enoyl-CoA hydratase family protein [Arthrobacter sp. zg-Y20]|uniref:crotonase/enoyl-CoA hydratase family protein n=1 Tax=unclassified Arthrobacter TaxID=235627 RepID=UPI001D139D9F|nr:MULTISPECIES: crotonase/enoyl-CoA hydratase family protein [unclassified Arthrobacter]MCC3276421.1 crotonase/enoyl-CoA hydratase family protein [Arthrobacter sp. zg-Y20]MDK1316580.1 crotonase/enoyl-CoA hydratase family protein [Arthrobacter sp. zg.Y20]MDK1328731.1 crotonase/enoyl-CoA hydratase family protein [Arthrobacter sp. zg-Y1143]WIB06619.1 crotonase/enoyl-CoA hydratase family protein [Arthrobacter sp. zg-Y20]
MTASTTTQLRSLRVDIRDGVAEVQLIGPSKGNAMGPDFWTELPEVFDALSTNDGVRSVLLYGSGGTFSYGLDLPAMAPVFAPMLAAGGMDAKLREDFRRRIKALQDSVSSLARCAKPVIAAVDGWCIGGAIDVIAAADIRISSPAARFSVREVKVAIVADLGSLQRLPAIIGEGATRHLALTGEDFDAARAYALGLVTELADDVVARGRELAAAVAANPPLVVQGVKQVMNRRTQGPVQDGLDYVQVWNTAFLASRDFGEATAAFAERRPPVYRGE